MLPSATELATGLGTGAGAGLPAWRAAAGLLATGIAAGTDFHTALAAEQTNAVDPAAVGNSSCPRTFFPERRRL